MLLVLCQLKPHLDPIVAFVKHLRVEAETVSGLEQVNVSRFRPKPQHIPDVQDQDSFVQSQAANEAAVSLKL